MSLEDIKDELALHLTLGADSRALGAATERHKLINLVSKAVGINDPEKEELINWIRETYEYKTGGSTSRPPRPQAGEIKDLTTEYRNKLIGRLGGDEAVKRGIEKYTRLGMLGENEALKRGIEKCTRRLRLNEKLRNLQIWSRDEGSTLTETYPPQGPQMPMTGPSARFPETYMTAAILKQQISSLPAIISLGDLDTSEQAIDGCISQATTYINYVYEEYEGRSVYPPGLPDQSGAQINHAAERAADAPPSVKAGFLPKPE